ncbi:MAG: hypothetical protein KAY32_16780 [Candidatus Eisenbacteria sp.]|nr:hypothetical protein [Candidatus Eisenbacteria bacterium]
MTKTSGGTKRSRRAEIAGEPAKPKKMIFPVVDASDPPRTIYLEVQKCPQEPREILVHIERASPEPRIIRVKVERVPVKSRIIRVPVMQVDPSDMRMIGRRRPGWPNAGRGQSEV